MNDIEQARRRRDQALNAWRREVQRLGEIVKSSKTMAVQVENQKKAVGEARELYDSLNDDYLNRIHSAKLAVPAAKAVDHLIH